MARYAIGDIHGGNQTFKVLLDQLNLKHHDQIYLLGDYIDRGNDSKGVLDTILLAMNAGYDMRPIRGNHDDMMLRTFTEDHDDYSWYWMRGWGTRTLESFEVDNVVQMSSTYLTLLDSLPYLRYDSEYVFVHASLDMAKDNPLKDSDPTGMMWEEMGDFNPQKIGGRKLVTGHTIRPLQLIEASLRSNEIKLDNGAFTNQQPDLGNLVALNLDTMELMAQRWLDGGSLVRRHDDNSIPS